MHIDTCTDRFADAARDLAEFYLGVHETLTAENLDNLKFFADVFCKARQIGSDAAELAATAALAGCEIGSRSGVSCEALGAMQSLLQRLADAEFTVEQINALPEQLLKPTTNDAAAVTK